MNAHKKIPLSEYIKFETRFFSRTGRGEGKRYQGQRFGQAFLNEFFPDIVDPKLFYAPSYDGAVARIFDEYVYVGESECA